MLVKELKELCIKKQKFIILGIKRGYFRAIYSGSRIPRKFRNKELLNFYETYIDDERWIVMEI